MLSVVIFYFAFWLIAILCFTHYVLSCERAYADRRKMLKALSPNNIIFDTNTNTTEYLNQIALHTKMLKLFNKVTYEQHKNIYLRFRDPRQLYDKELLEFVKQAQKEPA